jgi:hypothetical protein
MAWRLHDEIYLYVTPYKFPNDENWLKFIDQDSLVIYYREIGSFSPRTKSIFQQFRTIVQPTKNYWTTMKQLKDFLHQVCNDNQTPLEILRELQTIQATLTTFAHPDNQIIYIEYID